MELGLLPFGKIACRAWDENMRVLEHFDSDDLLVITGRRIANAATSLLSRSCDVGRRRGPPGKREPDAVAGQRSEIEYPRRKTS